MRTKEDVWKTPMFEWTEEDKKTVGFVRSREYLLTLPVEELTKDEKEYLSWFENKKQVDPTFKPIYKEPMERLIDYSSEREYRGF
jgi:hypothetical protein